MADIEAMKRALVNAHKAGDVAAAQKLAQAIKAQSVAAPAMPEPAAPATPDPIEQKAIALADYQEQIGRGESAGGLFSGGFALGLKDKVSGVANALTGLLPGSQEWNGETVGEDYRIGQRAQQILEERARQRSGALGTAAEIGGTIASGAMMAGPSAVSALGRIAQTGKQAGILGGIQGGGDSQAESIGGVLGDAAMGAGIGAVAGGALQGGLEAARPLIKGAVAGGRSLANLGGNVEDRAAKRIVRALAADEMTPGKAAARMQTRGQSLINVGDENVMGLGRSAAAQPGPGRQAINKALDAGQAARADKALQATKAFAPYGPNQPFNKRVAGLIQERGKAASGAYGKVYAAGDKEIWSSELERLSSSPSIKSAMQQAVAKWGDRSIADGFGAMNPGASVKGGILKMSAGKVPTFPNLQFWDYTKRALDDQISAAMRSGAKQEASALTGLASKLRDELDRAVPAYKLARENYATQSQLIEALKRGRDLMKPETLSNLDVLADDLARMSKPEKNMLRLGLSRALEDTISSTPDQAGNVVNKIFGTPQKRQAIRAMFENDSAFRRFEIQMRRLAKEAGVFKNIRTGSRTSFVDAEKQASGNLAEAATGLVDVARGGYVSATMKGLSKMLGNLGNMDEQTAARVAQILISEDPQFVMQALSKPANRQAQQQITDELLSRAFRIARGGAVVGGAAIGSAATASAQ